MYISEYDEVRLQRAHPTSHRLTRTTLSRAREAATTYCETTLLLSQDATHATSTIFHRAARDLVNFRNHPTVKLWFYADGGPDAADFATGIVQSWADNGEITFNDGTRLNDRLLVRVTF